MITDLTPYRKYVDKFDISEKRKLELVNALWAIAENILDQQFGLNQASAELEPESLEKASPSNPPFPKEKCANNKK